MNETLKPWDGKNSKVLKISKNYGFAEMPIVRTKFCHGAVKNVEFHAKDSCELIKSTESDIVDVWWIAVKNDCDYEVVVSWK